MGVVFGLVQHRFRLLLGQNGFGQAFFQAGQVQIRGRVVQNMVFPSQPFKEGSHRGDTGVLAASALGVTVLFAVVEQVLLIPLQNGLGDMGRANQFDCNPIG